jgi:hypothetical protein
MYDGYREVWRHRAVLPGEARKVVAGSPCDDDGPMLDMLGEGQPTTRPPCGGSCRRFGVQGCHSPRCCVGAE